jgi:hypothetical protein
MTKADILRMAREAGLTKGQHWNKQNMTTAFMCDFANLVAAHKAEVALAEAYRCGYKAGVVAEREACAEAAFYGYYIDLDGEEIAASIRARTTP